jgi:hypothetical protein
MEGLATRPPAATRSLQSYLVVDERGCSVVRKPDWLQSGATVLETK